MPVKVNLVTSNNRLESRMREIRQSGSAGGEVQINEPSLPLSDNEKLIRSLGEEDLPKSATTPCPNYEREAYDILQSKMSTIVGLKQRVYERCSSSTGQQQQCAE